MTRIIRSLSALSLVVGVVPATLAGPPGGHHHGPPPYAAPRVFTNTVIAFPHINTGYTVANYHVLHGTKFVNGIYYSGLHHNHWARIYFDPVYRCRLYWDPYVRVWYYYCPLDTRYYPVSYAPYGTYVFPVVNAANPIMPAGPGIPGNGAVDAGQDVPPPPAPMARRPKTAPDVDAKANVKGDDDDQ